MMAAVAVAVGGAIGSVARHGVNMLTARMAGGASPFATAAVNLIGSFVIGVLAGSVASERIAMTPQMRAFVFVGILGGFTTFSSFMLDAFALHERGELAGAALNVAGQVLLGYALIWAGYRLGL